MRVINLGGKAEVLMKLYTFGCMDSTAMPLSLYPGLLNTGLVMRLPCPMTLTLTLSIPVLMWLLQIHAGVKALAGDEASMSHDPRINFVDTSTNVTTARDNTGVRRLLLWPMVTSHCYQCTWL